MEIGNQFNLMFFASTERHTDAKYRLLRVRVAKLLYKTPF